MSKQRYTPEFKEGAVRQVTEKGHSAQGVAVLREEIEKLRAENAKINRAMRRCITCDYRVKSIAKT